MSKERDQVDGKESPCGEARTAPIDRELDRRLRGLDWPLAPPGVRDRGLAALLARQASMAKARDR